jgi:thiamine transporter
MKSNKKQMSQKVRTLCVSAIMLALATVLSLIKIWQFPWGGSITLGAMLPIAIVAICYGTGNGLFTAFLFSCIQLFLSLGEIMSWGLTTEMLIGTIILDYILPYTLIGLSGLFAGKGNKGKICGTVFAILLRYASHVVSGVVLWHSAGMLWEGLNIENEWLYSLAYNACYMLPEMIITVVLAWLIVNNKPFMRSISKNS